MKISVIIPVFNEEKYIKKCLDSLFNQNEKADEIIVINNNSTDNTVNIAKKYPVRILNERKQGITPTRNKGLNFAKYEIIARTDADTILPPDWIKSIKKTFSDKSIIAVSGPAEFNDLPELIKGSHPRTRNASIKIILTYNRIVKKILNHDSIYGPNCAIRKNAWEKIKKEICMDDTQVHEDLDLAIHLAPIGKIKFSRNIKVKTSARRWKKPESYLDYSFRGLKSIQKHKGIHAKQKSKLSVKKMFAKAIQDSFTNIPRF